MNKLDQLRVSSRVVPLEPGLHIFRYASILPPDEIVQISLQNSPMGKGQVDFFPAEGVTRNTLTKVGDCIIARVKSAAVGILVTEYRSANATRPVDLRLDRIDTSEAIARNPSPASTTRVTATAEQNAPVAPAGIAHIAKAAPASTPVSPRVVEAAKPARLLLAGHVTGRGAIEVESRGDAWLGQPDGNEPLEGFSITWADAPQGVELIYTCRVRNLGQMPATRGGQYVGTRNKGLPIHSISFLLAGPRAGEFELSGQVAFSGLPPQALQPGLALAGPTGREHLVALRPRIAAKSAIHAHRVPGGADAARTQPLSALNDQALTSLKESR